ncbi:MAG: MlaD family protein [Oligoflexia bacterium]|nr:MlaD family protein [Oligoflexia bacterium]
MEVKVGFFVAIGIGLVMLAILVLGSTENLLTRKTDYHSHFPNVDGLIEGAKVVLGGIQVGTVKKISFDMEKRDIRVDFAVSRDSAAWIRADSSVEIATQGVLGDKYVAVLPGNVSSPILAAGGEIPNRPSKGIAQFLTKGDQLMVNIDSLVTTLDRVFKNFETGGRSDIFFQGLSSTARNLSQASDKLNRELDELRLKKISRNLEGILEKINNGQGTLGALVNDPGLYDDAKKLVGEANRNRVLRNLVRQSIRDAKEPEKESQERR